MILAWLLLIPAIGGVLAWLAGGQPNGPRWIALLVLALDLVLALTLIGPHLASGIAPGRSFEKRWDIQPATINFCSLRRFRIPRFSWASKMALIDSSFEELRKEQVLTITTSAFSASGMTCMPA